MDFGEYSNQVRAWIDGIQLNRGRNPEITLQLCKQVIEYGERVDDEKLLGYAYYCAGETCYLQNDVDQLFRNITRSLTYLENTRQYELVARAYNILAITSANRGNAPFAMDYYLSALSYCDRHKLADISVMLDINIGTLYNSYGEYQKAQHYFEIAYHTLAGLSQMAGYHMYLTNIYIGMGNSYLAQEQLLKAQEYGLRAKRECYDSLEPVGQTCFLCFQARLYHSMGKQTQRDECIAQVQRRVHEKMIILDIFDDFYVYCEMLFDIGRYKEMLEVLLWLEELAQKTRIIHIQKRLLKIWIHYYQLQGDERAYMQACTRFYELTELSEKENQYMVSTMLNTRYVLEETSRRRQEMEQENRMLQRKSETDALTDLPNRFRLNEYSEEAFLRSLEQNHPLAVEILDIDYFKQYNDNYGHQEGDTCIRQIASAIQDMSDYGGIFCARYGGDEFILIYENYTREQVKHFAEELRQNIISLNIEHRYSLAADIVTISQGICWDIPKGEHKVWDYLHTADMMLYKGKKIGRNSIYIGYCGEE